MEAKIREEKYDMRKVISMICIMLLHIGDDYGMVIIPEEPVYYFSLGNICIVFTAFAVPCFLMISGAFLLSNPQNREFKLFYRKSFLRIGLPTLSVSTLYVCYNILKLYYHKNFGIELSNTPVEYFIEWFRGEPFYHLWYMYMLIGIYLLTPILIRLREMLDFKIWKNFAVFSLVASVILWGTSTFKIHWGLEGIVFLGYFLIGDVLKTYYDNHRYKKTLGNICIGFSILFLYCVVREYLIRNDMQKYLFAFLWNFHPLAMTAAVFIFSGFCNLKIRGRWHKISEKSFYMYLLHAGIIDVMYIVLPERWNPVFFIPVMLTVTFFVSYFASAFLLFLQKKGITSILVDIVSVVDLLIIRIRNRKGDVQNEDMILVRLDAIGDFVMWLDAAKEFKERVDGRIILICNQVCSEIAENTGYFDEVIGLNYGKLRRTTQIKYRWSMHGYLKGVRARQAVQCTYSREIFSDMVMSAVMANEKITIDSPETTSSRWSYRLADSIYQKKVDTPREHMMEICRNAFFTGQVLGREVRSGVPLIKGAKKAQSKVPAERYYVLFLGASETERMWTVDRFVELAEKLYGDVKYSHLKCCLCGGKEETYLADEFTERYFAKDKIINRAGQTSLPELIEIIRMAEFIVTNDTSAVHFATAVNTQAFCIWGPWEYGRFLPYAVENPEDRKLPIVCYHEVECRNCLLDGRGKTAECKRFIQQEGIRRCLSLVTVEDVIKKIDKTICIEGC